MKHQFGVLTINIFKVLIIYYHSPKYSGSLDNKSNTIKHRISNKLLVIKLLNKYIKHIRL